MSAIRPDGVNGGVYRLGHQPHDRFTIIVFERINDFAAANVQELL
jgi:hypothetical protein